MLNIEVLLENTTTDEQEICLQLPMEDTELRSKLMRNCDYLITEHDDIIRFRNYDDVFKLNEILSRLSAENPFITEDVLKYIFETTPFDYLDDEVFLQKLCDNDFMYEEIIIPANCSLLNEEYAAYILCTKYKVPFLSDETEMIEYSKISPNGTDWSSIWDVYSFMGFQIVEDCDIKNKIYIINMEDSEE